MSFMVLGLVILAVSLGVAIAAVLRGRLGFSCLMLGVAVMACLLYTSPSPRDRQKSRMPSSA